MQSTQTASLDSHKCPLFLCIWLLFHPAIPFHNSTGKTNKEPRKESCANIVWLFVTLLSALDFKRWKSGQKLILLYFLVDIVEYQNM